MLCGRQGSDSRPEVTRLRAKFSPRWNRSAGEAALPPSWRKKLTRVTCSQGLQQVPNAARPFCAQGEGLILLMAPHSAHAPELHPPSHRDLMDFTLAWYKSNYGNYDKFVNTRALKKSKVYVAKIYQEHSKFSLIKSFSHLAQHFDFII